MPITEVPSSAIFATLLGFVAAAIVLAMVLEVQLPFIRSERAGLVALVGVGLAMCAVGGWAADGHLPMGPTAIVASLAGALSLVVFAAVVLDWTAVLDPLAGLFYGRTSARIADRVGALAIGTLIAVAWVASTLRQIGLVTAG